MISAPSQLEGAKSALSVLRREFELLLPDAWRSRLLISRRRKVWQRAGVIFIHVPKAAGTSISQELYGQFVGHIPARHLALFAPDLFEVLPRFTVVRHPFKRVVSSFQFASRGADLGSGPVAGMFHPEKYRGKAFRSLDSFVQEWLIEQDLLKVDYVFRPQTFYTHSELGEFLAGHLGRLEDMNALTQYLRATLGRNINIGHFNRTGQSGEPTDVVLGPASRKVVEKLYRNDFEFLGYAP